MSDLLQLLEIIAVGALLLIVFAVLSDPFAFLGAAFEAWNAKAAHDQAADSELTRKCAIADAAIAARARGEPFTPPADYDR